MEPAQNQQGIMHQHHDAAIQAKLFGKHGEDEVSGALGNEVELRLRPHQIPFPVDTPGSDGNHGLDRVEPFAERIHSVVEQGAHTMLLVLMQYHPVNLRLTNDVLVLDATAHKYRSCDK